MRRRYSAWLNGHHSTHERLRDRTMPFETERKMHRLFVQTEFCGFANFFLFAQAVRQPNVQPIFLFQSTTSSHKKGRHERTP